MISEYVEGSSFNKYLEVYNGTGASVDLADYRISLYANGSATPTTTSALSGTLTNNGCIVYKHSSAALTLPTGVTAVALSAVNYNGDDAVALYKISAGQNVDIFGRIGEDPGSYWGTGAFTTADHTLRRKAAVTAGIGENPGSGFPTLETEWDVFAQNTADGLGSHTMDGGTSQQPPVLAAIGNRDVVFGGTLTFDVTATDANGDAITLSASDLPPRAVFAAVTNAAAVTNTFLWTNAAPVGVYTTSFHAADAGGSDSETITITVRPAGLATGLIISEYGEGTGNNKYIELFNGTGSPVDLGAYALRKQVNGAGPFTNALALSGTLAHNATYVIVNAGAATGLKDLADLATSSSALTFNGNDAVGLFRNGALSDVVGNVDDANVWGADVVLVRLSSVKSPNPVYSPGEWAARANQDWSNVGLHSMDGIAAPPAPPALTLVPSATRVILQAGTPYAIALTATEPNGDTVTLTQRRLPAGATLTPDPNVGASPLSSTFNWTPSSGGTSTAVFVASDSADGTGAVVTVTFEVSPFETMPTPGILINEVLANDAGTDNWEFVEIVAPAGTDLQGCVLRHYNGADDGDGPVWSFTFPSFVVPDDGVLDSNGDPLGFAVVGMAAVTNVDFTIPGMLQNDVEGLVLYDASGGILDAVAWEAFGSPGSGDIAVDDPGGLLTAGNPSTPNYLHELPPDDLNDSSLQAPDDVLSDPGRSWQVINATPGALNGTQHSGRIVVRVLPPPPNLGLRLIVK